MSSQTEQAQEPLLVAIQGVSPRSRAVLDRFFATQTDPPCRIVDDPTFARVAILDLDGPKRGELLVGFRQQFRGPTLVLSARDPRLEDAKWIAKPVKPSVLLSALADASRQAVDASDGATATELSGDDNVASATTSNAKPATAFVAVPTGFAERIESPASTLARAETQIAAADRAASIGDSASLAASMEHKRGTILTSGLMQTERRRHPSYGILDEDVYLDPNERDRCFYDPSRYFQGTLQTALRQAHQTQLPLRIKLKDVDKGITLFPVQQWVQSDVRENFLRSLVMVQGSGEGVEFESLSADTLPIDGEHHEARLQTEFDLMWKVALWSSLGRAPIGTDPEQPIELSRWPNFSRIFISYHAIQIAALWSQRPVSLMQTARTLGIEHRYVFTFFAAASAVGVVRAVKRAPVELRSVPFEQQPGFFGRFLGYLGARD